MYDPLVHHRRSIRLPECDYSNRGFYALTLRIHDSNIALSTIHNEYAKPNDVGRMIEHQWLELPKRFQNVGVHEHVVMPDHFHGIISLNNELNKQAGGQRLARPLRQTTLGEVVQVFKSITTNEYIRGVKDHRYPSFQRFFWQRNYYEHIVRDAEELIAVKNYILSNPSRWVKRYPS